MLGEILLNLILLDYLRQLLVLRDPYYQVE